MHSGRVKLEVQPCYPAHRPIHWNGSRYKNLRNDMVRRCRLRHSREVVAAVVAATAVREVAVSIDFRVGMPTN